jgi:O-antigen/teichoic acid export membrane protein
VPRQQPADPGPAIPDDTQPPVPAERSAGNGRRALWTFADQALSSLTNAALTVVVARAVGAEAFGAFALALLTFSFVIGLGRAMIGDPYVIRFSDADPAARHTATRQSSGAAVVFGLLAGMLCAVAGLLIPDQQSRGGLLALAISLPGLLLQDNWRYAFFAARRPAAATLNDAIWALLQFSLLGVLFVRNVESVFWITMAWGMSALVAAAFGVLQIRAVPSVTSARRWFHLTRDLNVRMGIDFAFNMGAVNLAIYVITAVVGLVAAGALRAAQTLLGPLNLFRSGLDSFVLPMMARRAGEGRSLLRLVTVTSGAATALTGVWVGVLLLLPTSIGEEVLGDSWAGARLVMIGSGIVAISQAVVLGASLGIKALRRADLLLRVTLIQAPLILGFGGVGAWQWGIVGAANGLGIAQFVGTILSWYYFRGANGAERHWVRSSESAYAA